MDKIKVKNLKAPIFVGVVKKKTWLSWHVKTAKDTFVIKLRTNEPASLPILKKLSELKIKVDETTVGAKLLQMRERLSKPNCKEETITVEGLDETRWSLATSFEPIA